MMEDARVPQDNPRLQFLEAVTLTGASATVAILLNENRLSIAYVGDTRAVVASIRPDNVIKALQLTVDHVIGKITLPCSKFDKSLVKMHIPVQYFPLTTFLFCPNVLLQALIRTKRCDLVNWV